MDEDITVFFREFSTPVTVSHPDGCFTLRAIFDNPDMFAALGETDANLNAPRLTLSSTEATRLRAGLIVEVKGETKPYRISDIQPDGTGISTVILVPHTPRSDSDKVFHDELIH